MSQPTIQPMFEQFPDLGLEAEAACWAMMEVARRDPKPGQTLGGQVREALVIVQEQIDKGTLGLYVETNYVDWDALRERSLG